MNGNITSIETPSLHQNVAVEPSQGYGLCDQSTGIIYHDFAGMGDAGTGNWVFYPGQSNRNCCQDCPDHYGMAPGR